MKKFLSLICSLLISCLLFSSCTPPASASESISSTSLNGNSSISSIVESTESEDNSSSSGDNSDDSETPPSEETTIDFSNKTMACLGDSITRGLCKGVEMDTPYPSLLKEKIGLKEIFNLGIGGSTICTKNYNSMVSRYDDIPDDCDIISVHGGVNDWAQSFELGNMDSSNTRTIYGALHYLASNLKATYPNSFIFFMTPLPVSDAKLEQYASTPYSLEDISNAFKNIGQKYNLPVLDLYSLSGFEDFCNNTEKTDGIHPNQDFHKDNLSPLIAQFIKDNYKEKRAS